MCGATVIVLLNTTNSNGSVPQNNPTVLVRKQSQSTLSTRNGRQSLGVESMSRPQEIVNRNLTHQPENHSRKKSRENNAFSPEGQEEEEQVVWCAGLVRGGPG